MKKAFLAITAIIAALGFTSSASIFTGKAAVQTASQPATKTPEFVIAPQPVAVEIPVVPPDEDFEVVQNKDGATITIKRYKGSATNISIPQTLYGLPVTAIGGNAFEEKNLTNVVIPEGITTIENGIKYKNSYTASGAFSGNKLVSLFIPNSVTFIGDYAFYNNQLANIAIGNKVTTIGNAAFQKNQLTRVQIPDSVTTIMAFAFRENKLISVVVPENVTVIEANAFSFNRLTSVTMGNSVTSIGRWAFNENLITDLIIPQTVVYLADYAFQENRLASITVPKSVESIGFGAFEGNQIVSITIEKDIPGINAGAGFEKNFINFYESQGRTPGTYIKNGPIWSKQ
jgi:hypothetical protein